MVPAVFSVSVRVALTTYPHVGSHVTAFIDYSLSPQKGAFVASWRVKLFKTLAEFT
jgi:hypothetical protein